MRKRLVLFLSFALACMPLRGQFSHQGSEPPGLKWKEIVSASYRVIYPAGTDSLARVFANSLEKYKRAVSGTLGYVPNQNYSTPMPVVLHPFTSYNNGMVAWAPRRMSLLAVPDGYDPESLFWTDYLAVHEERHVAQMQFIRGDRTFRLLNAAIGEMWAGAAAAMYPGPALLEGDAVAAETALSASGRGRSADFLEYWRVSLADSLYRDFWQWRYGSQKRYTPDYYRAGYVLVSGMRTSFDDPFFMNRYYSNIFSRPRYPFFNLHKTVKESSGMKFAAAFRKIQDDLAAEQRRSGGSEGSALTPAPRRYEELRGLVFTGDTLLAVRHGLARAYELVQIDSSGAQKRLSSFGATTSRPAWSPSSGRLYFTEYLPDRRWELVGHSALRYYGKGRLHTLSDSARYYNPAPRPEGGEVAVTVYGTDGSCAVVVISEENGEELRSYPAPAGMQPVEPAWLDGELYVSAIGADGFGVYRAAGWETVLEPLQCKINRLFPHEGRLWFNSDLDGTNQLYSLALPSSGAAGTLWKETDVRGGGNDWAFHGGSLYYSSPRPAFRGVRTMPADSLLGEEASVPEGLRIADILSLQEPFPAPADTAVEISAPAPYSKMRDLFKVHSWAPVYVEYDAVSGLSYESTSTPSFLGASAWFQNLLENFYGQAGVSVETPWLSSGSDSLTRARPAFHAQAVWDGWYPVIEMRADVNRRSAFRRGFAYDEEGKSYSGTKETTERPLVALSLNAYIPWNFSSGGWLRGIIPSVKATWSNDRWQILPLSVAKRGLAVPATPVRSTLMTAASVRGYSVQRTPSSCLFPRWGIGAEASVTDMPLMRQTYGGTAGVLVYGYVPGILRTHGLRLSARASRSFGSDWSDRTGMQVAAEYAMPFGAVDWSFLCPAFYIRNFELRGYASYGLDSSRSKINGSVTSLVESSYMGASLAVHLGNFLWIPYDTRVGAKYLYNPVDPSLSGFSMIFSVDL